MAFRLFGRRRAEDYDELPVGLWREVSEGRPALEALSTEDASALRRLASWFKTTKDFVPTADFAVSEIDEAEIAALACLPILRLGMAWYDDWSTVLVAPDGFSSKMVSVDEAGVVEEYDDELSGQVTELGPVLLSLPDVRESGFGDGYNVVVHEMAHKLDARDGVLDGRPPLPRGVDARAWNTAFGEALEDLRAKAERSARRGRGGRARGSARLPLDDYATESPEEFFAVACEAYFDCPTALEWAYPEVFSLLCTFFAGR